MSVFHLSFIFLNYIFIIYHNSYLDIGKKMMFSLLDIILNTNLMTSTRNDYYNYKV